MRTRLAIALAVASFGLGAWFSPGAGAQTRIDEWLPESLKPGQRITVSVPESTTCEVTEKARHWVRCRNGMWFNLQTGAGYVIAR